MILDRKTKLFDFDRLSKQETAIVYYWMRGFSDKEIARFLKLSQRTVQYYQNNIRNKFNKKSTYQIRCLYWEYFNSKHLKNIEQNEV